MNRPIFSIYDENTDTFGPVFSDSDFSYHVTEFAYETKKDPSSLVLFIVATQDPSTCEIEPVEHSRLGTGADYLLRLQQSASMLH